MYQTVRSWVGLWDTTWLSTGRATRGVAEKQDRSNTWGMSGRHRTHTNTNIQYACLNVYNVQ